MHFKIRKIRLNLSSIFPKYILKLYENASHMLSSHNDGYVCGCRSFCLLPETEQLPCEGLDFTSPTFTVFYQLNTQLDPQINGEVGRRGRTDRGKRAVSRSDLESKRSKAT